MILPSSSSQNTVANRRLPDKPRFLFLSLTLTLTLGALLSGCGTVNSLPLVGKASTPVEPVTALTLAPSPAPAPAAPPAPRIIETDLIGLDSANADALIGQQPAAIIREGAGEIRRYAGQQCNLLVILYPDGRGKRSVQTVESTNIYSGASRPDVQTCLNGF